MANPFVGEIRMFAGNFAPQGWKFCDGQLLPIVGNQTLFGLIGTTYGGTGDVFALPDLRGRIPIHPGPAALHPLAEKNGTETVTLTVEQMPSHTHPMWGSSDPASPLSSPAGSLLANTGAGQAYDATFTKRMSAQAISTNGNPGAHDNMAPYLCVSFIIFGDFPPPSLPLVGPFIGEIMIFAGKAESVPAGWALCDGQFLPKDQNSALFSVIDTIYGGDSGGTLFALPDLRGCSPMHQGAGAPPLIKRSLGEHGGEETVTLSISQIPAHSHQLLASDKVSASAPQGNLLGQSDSARIYGPDSNLVPMAGVALSLTGGSQPHDNRQPYLVLNFIIALQGTNPTPS